MLQNVASGMWETLLNTKCRRPYLWQVGDIVVIPKYGGTELKFDEQDFHVYRDEDIVGIMQAEWVAPMDKRF